MNLANIFKSFIHSSPPKFFVKKFGRTCLDFLFPRKCLGCGQVKTWLCPDCLNSLPSSYSPNEDKIFSVFEYNSPIVKQVIWHLKYKRVLELAEILAKPMFEMLLEELQDELIVTQSPSRTALDIQYQGQSLIPIILIPAPLSPARFRSRGYNQSAELAKQIAKLNPNQFEVRTDIIKKVKNTPTQVSIKNRTNRLANLKGAFALSSRTALDIFSPPDLRFTRGLARKVIVIVDDVSTTGATINEIRQLLHREGARHVYGLVVAHG